MVNSMNKFTPGPWRVDATVSLGAYGVSTAYGDHKGYDGQMYPSQVCSVLTDSTRARAESRDVRDANAELIAAAPDLLEACEDALHDYEAGMPPGHVGSTVLKMRAAIAKARNTEAGH